MRQKIQLSAALLHDPQVLVLDEPFSGLDVTSALVLKSLLKRLAAEGKAIFYSSHVLEVVEQVATRVIILRKGKVVAADAVSRLRSMLAEPSLEGVFQQLAVEEKPEQIAAELIQAMKG